MGQFNLSDYETVQSRLPKFFAKYEKGRVITNLESDISDLSTVVFKAELWDGDTVLSTGWAFEKEGAGYVNKTSHVENCETSAIGRALANITIHGDKRASREEMEKIEKHEKVNDELLTLDQVTVIQDEINERQGMDDITGLLKWIGKTWNYNVEEIADIKQGNYNHILKKKKKKPLRHD
ncbi:MAG: hypothetical protein GY861_12870 [bacterium]|nr:hypothetical protein [bacterium]